MKKGVEWYYVVNVKNGISVLNWPYVVSAINCASVLVFM